MSSLKEPPQFELRNIESTSNREMPGRSRATLKLPFVGNNVAINSNNVSDTNGPRRGSNITNLLKFNQSKAVEEAKAKFGIFYR